ncbi:hypothetical protein HNQ91_003802 [Filimonas zeae]|uniref:hypothetical protein n=1 Tax=Filimonas zeae TaxID=1737353 RepID=UPI001664B170|nr:hypothetical protein [Filimonas zeae]MDR6340737.1 hypothetical protein [Filimonas zeae]
MHTEVFKLIPDVAENGMITSAFSFEPFVRYLEGRVAEIPVINRAGMESAITSFRNSYSICCTIYKYLVKATAGCFISGAGGAGNVNPRAAGAGALLPFVATACWGC